MDIDLEEAVNIFAKILPSKMVLKSVLEISEEK